MATYKYKHLTLDDRIAIQKGLKERLPFAEIAASIGKDPSTISKEVRGHLIVKETGTRSRPFNPCMGRKNLYPAAEGLRRMHSSILLL